MVWLIATVSALTGFPPPIPHGRDAATDALFVKARDAYLAREEPTVEVLEIRGLARVAREDLPGAIADYTRAIEINPKSATVHLDLAELLLCGGNAEACLAELQKVEYPVAPDKDRLILSYLRLLATRALGQDTSSLEAEFAALLGKNIPLAWETDEIEQWLASGNVDPATQAFAIGLNKRLKAKIQK